MIIIIILIIIIVIIFNDNNKLKLENTEIYGHDNTRLFSVNAPGNVDEGR